MSCLKKFILLISIGLLASCAQFQTTTPLPVNSDVTVISSLSNAVRYDHIGITIFTNSHFDYYNSRTGLTLENALIAKLQREKGYRVNVKHVSETSMIDFVRGYRGLPATEKRSALLRFAGNPNTKRVILLLDKGLYIYNYNTSNTVGIGYMSTGDSFLTRVYYFGATEVFVYDVSRPEYEIDRFPQHYVKTSSDLFANNPNEVSNESLSRLHNWVGSEYSAVVWESMQKAGV